jgi:hypothetical protein
MIAFIAIEIFLAGFIGPLLSGRFVGHIFFLKIEIFLMLFSYFLGGLLVGLFSPGIRIFEPAVGAALAVFFTCAYSFFTPHRFYGFRFGQMSIGAIIAFVLALLGADLGERLAARLGNRRSQDYARH